MNSRSLYNLLFSEVTTQTDLSKFDKIKHVAANHDDRRSVLRGIKTDDGYLEEKLFPTLSSSEPLPILTYFRKVNTLQFAENNSILRIYHRLLSTCAFLGYLGEDNLHDKDSINYNVFQYAYQLMIYFGSDDIDNILERYEKFCRTKPEPTEFTPARTLPVFNEEAKLTQEQLANWQNILEKAAYSEEAFTLFSFAAEIEEYLGHSPQDLTEARKTFPNLDSQRAWTHEELHEKFNQCETPDSRKEFLEFLTQKNLLSEFIKDNEELINTFTKWDYKPALAATFFFPEFNKEHIKTLLDTHEKQINLIRVLDKLSIQYYEENVGLEFILKNTNTLDEFKTYLTNLPADYDKSEFLTKKLTETQLKKFVKTHEDLLEILPFISSEKRLSFCKQKFNPQSINSTFGYLANAAKKLPEGKRIPFIQSITPSNELQQFYQSTSRDELKAALTAEEKLEFNKLAYTEEELEAKAILKEVKRSIQETEWTPEFRWIQGAYERVYEVNVGKKDGSRVKKAIPSSMYEHVRILNRDSHVKHSTVVAQLKNVGKKIYAEQYSPTLWNKATSYSNASSHFEKFKDDQTFDTNFKRNR